MSFGGKTSGSVAKGQLFSQAIKTTASFLKWKVFLTLKPNISIQILQTYLYTFPFIVSWENLIKDHGIFPLVIILLILITFSIDYVLIILGEN